MQHWIAAPPPRRKIFSPQDVIHLEDESGRVALVGKRLRDEIEREGGGLVTGMYPCSPFEPTSEEDVLMFLVM